MRPRHLIVALVLLGSFVLDAPARHARGIVVDLVPKWLPHLLAHGAEPVTLAAALGGLLVVTLAVRDSRFNRAATALVTALAATAVSVLALKWLASRGPDGIFHGFGTGDNGIMFPSGHAAVAFAVFEVVAAAWHRARWAAGAVALGVAFACAMLIHFLSDVVAGAMIGDLIGRLTAAWALRAGLLAPAPGPDPPPASDPPTASPDC